MIGLSKSRYFLVKCLNNKEDSVEPYNACNMFLCEFWCTYSYLCLLQTTLLAQTLYWEEMLLVHPNTLSQNPCHLCPPYLPTMWYFLPFQVNTSCATFKQFKSYYLLFVSTIPTYYMVFLCHSKVHYLSATFKISFLVFAIHSSWESSLKKLLW